MTRLTGNQNITGEYFTEPVWFDGGHITLKACVAPEFRFSRPQSAALVDCMAYRDNVVTAAWSAKEPRSYGFHFTGGQNISLDRCWAVNQSIGLEVSPGMPWSFQDEAVDRQIGGWWSDGNQFQGGTNLGGCISGTLKVTGNGTSIITVDISRDDADPIHRLDRLSLTHNDWYATGTTVRCLADNGVTVTLEAPIWESGKEYILFCVNPAYEVQDVRVSGCSFLGCKIAGASYYHVNGLEHTQNTHAGSIDDYDYGFEQCRNAIGHNNNVLDDRPNGGAGIVGLAENVAFTESCAVRGQANERPWVNVSGVKEVLQQSPWEPA